MCLSFEEADAKKPPSKLDHTARNAPVRLASSKVHDEIAKDGDDNIGVKSAHSAERTGEAFTRKARSIQKSRKRKTHERLNRTQQKSIKADVNYLYKKSHENSASPIVNPISKWQQKRAIKKQYLANHYGKSSPSTPLSIPEKLARASMGVVTKVSASVGENKRSLLFFAIAAVIMFNLMILASSIVMIFQGTMQGVLTSSYTSENDELIKTDDNFTQMEQELQATIDNIEDGYPDIDEFRYDLDEIAHDPHELAAYLTSINKYFTAWEIQNELDRLFDLMYDLTITEVVETRYRTETHEGTYTTVDEDGNEEEHEYSYEVEVPYDYYILYVTLRSKTVTQVANSVLNEKELELFNVYRETLGNKPLLFGGGSDDRAPSTDLSGVEFIDGERLGNQEIVDIALSQVGNIGGQPYWSWYGFDSRVAWCATYVSWVLSQSGYSEPKFAACHSQGVPYFAENGQWASRGFEDIAPGDVIFFDWEGDGRANHVGIVVGTDGERVYTVEGNAYDECKVRDYAIDSSVILGYGLMN